MAKLSINIETVSGKTYRSIEDDYEIPSDKHDELVRFCEKAGSGHTITMHVISAGGKSIPMSFITQNIERVWVQ